MSSRILNDFSNLPRLDAKLKSMKYANKEAWVRVHSGSHLFIAELVVDGLVVSNDFGKNQIDAINNLERTV